MSAGDKRWMDLVAQTGVVEGDAIRGVSVHHARAPMDCDDIALCSIEQADARAASMRAAGGRGRATTPDRLFLSRALREDAHVAVALVTRAAIASWTALRGERRPMDAHERRALALAEAHLAQAGHPVDDHITRHQRQLAPDRKPAPVGHDGPQDVVRKAVARLVRHLDGRVAVVP